MTLFRRPIIMLLVAITLIGQANADVREPKFYRNFWYPTYMIQRLDYCLFNGSECGETVANRYCKMLGYEKAGEQIIDNNVGLTNYLLSRAYCKGWKCNGFKLITCVGTFSHKPVKDIYYRSMRFVYPRFDHYRVDWCYDNGTKCGKRVAYSFCRRMGYMHAQGFKKQDNVSATKALGNQKLCFGHQCSGFSEITCYR